MHRIPFHQCEMRILFTIPHFFRNDGHGVHGSTLCPPHVRSRAVATCVGALNELFGHGQLITDIGSLTSRAANNMTRANKLAVVLCTSGQDHLLSRLDLPQGSFVHQATDCEPQLLGFECHRVLAENIDRYDYFCYLEDDLILHDPWFFMKLTALTTLFSDRAVFQPNRYEAPRRSSISRAYIDGALPPSLLEPYKDIQAGPICDFSFLGHMCHMRIADNPHSGCFFLNAKQMQHWTQSTHFLSRDTSFVGPLESAATLGILRHFAIYKSTPDCANFLEIEHFGNLGSANIGSVISLPPHSQT